MVVGENPSSDVCVELQQVVVVTESTFVHLLLLRC